MNSPLFRCGYDTTTFSRCLSPFLFLSHLSLSLSRSSFRLARDSEPGFWNGAKVVLVKEQFGKNEHSSAGKEANEKITTKRTKRKSSKGRKWRKMSK